MSSHGSDQSERVRECHKSVDEKGLQSWAKCELAPGGVCAGTLGVGVRNEIILEKYILSAEKRAFCCDFFVAWKGFYAARHETKRNVNNAATIGFIRERLVPRFLWGKTFHTESR